MRLWPFGKQPLERRDDSYTDTLVSAILATASGQAQSGLTAGVEIASGHWQRAFSSADMVNGGAVADALAPHLGFIGRALVRKGEAVFYLATERGEFELLPCHGCNVTGEPSPATWQYEVTLAGPSTTTTRKVGRTGFCTCSMCGLRLIRGGESARLRPAPPQRHCWTIWTCA